MILSRDEMLAVERGAFESGRTSAEALMNEVGRRMAERICLLSNPAGPGLAVVYLGKGNNAGDALVAARWLRMAGWQVCLRLAGDRRSLGGLAAEMLDGLGPPAQTARLTAAELHMVLARHDFAARPAFVILDGLLGVGAKGALRDPIKSVARELNTLRRVHRAQVFALDLPSGLDAETGALPDEDAIVADVTLTVGFAKNGLVADAAVNHVGHLEVIPLPDLAEAARTVLETRPRSTLTTRENLAASLPPRAFESNKTDYGRVGVIAGAVGTTGAAVMCALGALRAGAGLVTLLVHEKIYPTAAVTAAPEVMVKPIHSFLDALDEKFDVIAIGPGLSPHEEAADLLALIEKWPHAMVVDAGAVTALASDTSILSRCAGPRLLTPHSGEMERLWKHAPSLGGRDMKSLARREVVTSFCDLYPAALLLKGARTLVGQQGEPLSYNTTGNPGMATGGMGDVLTGVCAALIGQGLPPYDAARLGAFLCGRAAEMAVRDGGESEQSLIALDLPRFFGRVFGELRHAAASL